MPSHAKKKIKIKNQCYKSICIIVSDSGSIQFKSGFQFIIKKKKNGSHYGISWLP